MRVYPVCIETHGLDCVQVQGPPQIEVADDPGRDQVEDLSYRPLEMRLGRFRGAVRVDPDRHTGSGRPIA